MSDIKRLPTSGWIELISIAVIGAGVFRLFGEDWAILSVGLALYIETVR